MICKKQFAAVFDSIILLDLKQTWNRVFVNCIKNNKYFKKQLGDSCLSKLSPIKSNPISLPKAALQPSLPVLFKEY